jgi:hypothetical protein
LLLLSVKVYNIIVESGGKHRLAQKHSDIGNGVLEEVVLFCSLLKWSVLAILTGALIGAGVAFFLKAVSWTICGGGYCYCRWAG